MSKITTVTVLDIETTGLLEPEHRIIELYAGKYEFPSGKLRSELNLRIDPQRSIAADAYRVHNISGMDLIGKPVFEDVAGDIFAFLNDADLLVGHNSDEFDLPFISQELRRVGLPIIVKPSFDSMSCKWATPSGKPPSLQELCLACDTVYDPTKAHAASYDVEVLADCFFKANAWGWIELPKLPLA